MKLPRDLDAPQLVKALGRLGYRQQRQSGSHVRLKTEEPQAHSITIPNHSPLKLGTLAAVLADVAAKQGMSREALLAALFAD